MDSNLYLYIYLMFIFRNYYLQKIYIEKDIILALIIPIFNLHTLASSCIAYFLFIFKLLFSLFIQD